MYNFNNINTNIFNNINNKLNKKRNNYNNINTNYINNKENIKEILYSKAKVSDKTFNKNYTTGCRNKTMKYIKRTRNMIQRNNNKKNDNNIITKTQEIQFQALSNKFSEKTLSNLDKTVLTNSNLISPYNKQKSYIKHKTNLTNEINDITIANTNEFKKHNIDTLSEIFYNNKDETIDNFILKKYNNTISKLGRNLSYDKILSNFASVNDIIINDNKLEQILNLLNLEDLLIIEDKYNLILIVLEKGNNTHEEYFDLLNYFFSSELKSKLEKIFLYFSKETEIMKIFIKYILLFIIICYDFSVNSININIDNNFSLIEIAQKIYTNILIVINIIKNKIILDNKDNYNIRLIELSKIELTIKNKLSNFDNDFSFSKEILYNNSNIVIKKISTIIESNIINDILIEKYNSEIFSKINTLSFEEINLFFREKILKENFIGCSVLASTYLKENKILPSSLTPYLRVKNKKKYSLILDLDETLVHFKVNNNEKEEGVLKLRPGVFLFLEKVKEYYEIILFTEASEAYTKLIMEAFNNKKFFNFKLYRQHTIIDENDFIKDLSRIGRPLDKTIIIDNMLQNFRRQKNNGILIKPFLGEDENDKALIDLIPILTNIAKDEIDVRNGLTKYKDEIITKISSNLFRRNKCK